VVAGLGVTFEADAGAEGQEDPQGGRRLWAVALHRAVGSDALGRVDAEQSHPLDGAAGDSDIDRVAVHDRHDDAPVGWDNGS
jgi:hypothetical protein